MPTNSPGTDNKAGPLRYTKHYVYNSADSLGKGATATVYLGRNRQSGEQVAIKRFTDDGRVSRHIEQSKSREIELLTSLSHRNVMRILACEEEEISKNVVIIMPYCQEGSVQTLLDQPQHGYGFKEKEFLRFLSDITNGFQYLKLKGIIHRDIKPGNILKRIEEDGSSLYILTDFGAARRLDEEETFMSIYGTEEYIHPNMFQRAVLRQPGQSQFTATVDLWSLGITVFQVATGKLPFKALGGRNDSEMMFKLISERQSGDISGVQQANGQVERSKRLPHTCYLSSGLKSLLEPMLAGIFEINQSAVWTFERYFETVNSIIEMKTLDVFFAQNGTNMKLYLRKTDCYRNIQENIASLTDISADRQLLLLSHSELQNVIDTNEQIQTYPKSVQKSQLFLFERDNYDQQRLVNLNLPSVFPTFSVNSSLSDDSSVAKQCAALASYAEWTSGEILKRQQLLHDSKLNLRYFVQEGLAPLGRMVPELEKMLDVTKRRLSSLRTSQSNIKNFKCILDIISTSPTVRKFSKAVDRFCKEDNSIEESINKVSVRIEEINVYLSVLSQRLNELSTSSPADHLGCHEDDHCLTKMEHVRVGVQTVMSTFSKHKKYGNLHPHERFIHSVERGKMENYLVRIDTFHTHCKQNLQTVHTATSKTISMILKHLTRKGKVETNLQCVVECQGQINDKLNTLDENYRRVSEVLSSAVKELLENPGIMNISDKPKPDQESIRSTTSIRSSTSTSSERLSTTSSTTSSDKSRIIQQLLTQVTELQASKTELTSILESNTRQLQELLSDTDDVVQIPVHSDVVQIPVHSDVVQIPVHSERTSIVRTETIDPNSGGACGHS